MKAVIKCVDRLKPAKILLLGTSTKMVDKIAERLTLPAIKEYVLIEQIASEKEIRKARRMRTQHSKHVIPAPTIEVRKSLPETIIDPIQVFLRRKGYQGNRGWLEQSIVRPTFTMYGRLSISQGALGAIATHAAAAVPGVVEVKRSNIIRSEQEVTVEIEVILDITSKITDTSRDIQSKIKKYIETMTGLSIKSINVTVAGIKVQEIV
ncbi:Asp23/Gls24 family envelope stress response protein [Desulfotruncus alcoholivorax]|uniref:Asp23/Gls24 family envelope stress response protein n=1 Tax=Desulfotruncus alcoholivorax TaxID=265477 RepID=UPI00389916FB